MSRKRNRLLMAAAALGVGGTSAFAGWDVSTIAQTVDGTNVPPYTSDPPQFSVQAHPRPHAREV